MPLTPPSEAIYPKSKFKKVTVLYDGTQHPYLEFSIAQIELHNGEHVIGIRHDRNRWNANNDENGYPVVRFGRPTWFILPDMASLMPVLTTIYERSALN
jgi:hypothetical protein